METLKKVSVFVLCVAVIAILFFFKKCGNTSKQSYYGQTKDSLKTNADSSSFINHSLEKMYVPLKSYTVSAENDTTVIYNTGTVLSIPKDAFLDKDGKTVKGNVQLYYREWHKPLDFYVSGIPMVYDSAGTKMTFESAGMCEIKASQNGEPLFVNPKSKINIQMVSLTDGSNYGMYKLDTVNRKWVYIGKDSVLKTTKASEINKADSLPEPPKEANKYAFYVVDDLGQYPELSFYKNVLFEPVNGKACGCNSTNITIKKGTAACTYEITFSTVVKGKVYSSETCVCYPVFKAGADYNAALKAYHNKYIKLLQKREMDRARIDSEWSAYQKAIFNYEWKFISPQERISRVFSVNNFGIMNCDCPSLCPVGAELIADFTDKNGNVLSIPNVICLSELNGKALYRYWDMKVRFNPQKENLLWGVTSDGRVAYLTADEMKAVKATSGKYTFRMNVHPPVSTEKEIEDLLINKKTN